jgi:thioredoxin reductase (NADPH)
MEAVRDVLVVGAGPAGLAVAIAAVRAGLSHEVIEKGVLVNAIYGYPHGMTFFTTAELLELGEMPFVTPFPKPTREEALVYYRRVTDAFRLDVSLGERVEAIEPRDGLFIVRTARARPGRAAVEGARRARNVVVATGYYDTPKRLGVPGEDLPHVAHYFDEAHPYHGRRVIVVGGSNSAAEAALLLCRAGARVTLVHRRARLSGSIKYWVKPDVENRIAEGRVAARLESRVVEITPDEVRIDGPAGPEAIPADAVFLLTGYLPDVGLLERAGVRVDPATRKAEHDPETFATNVPGLYLAGSIAAGADSNRIFIENGRFHGAAIVRSILSKAAAPRPAAAS